MNGVVHEVIHGRRTIGGRYQNVRFNDIQQAFLTGGAGVGLYHVNHIPLGITIGKMLPQGLHSAVVMHSLNLDTGCRRIWLKIGPSLTLLVGTTPSDDSEHLALLIPALRLQGRRNDQQTDHQQT